MPRPRQLKQDIRYYPKALMEKLENIMSYPMTLLEADSGFGKSTALQHFFDTRNPEAYPLHQHEFHSETPAEAWKIFCGLIAAVDKESAERLSVIGMPDEDTMPEIARTIHNISCGRETFLLLDNFQLWELYRPCEFLKYLSDHGGEKLHIVVATHPYAKDERGELELLLSFLEYNRIDAMSERHRRALELLGGAATLINNKSTWTFGSPSVLYMYWRESGKLDEELEQMDECMPYYYRLSKGHGTGAELIMRAEAHLHRGETDDAEILCHRAIFTADSKHQNSIAQCGVFTLARLALLHGDRELLEDSLATLRDRSYRNTEDLCRYTYDLAKGYLSLLLGKPEEVAPWLAEGKIDDRRLVIMSQPFAHIIYGRVLLEKKEYKKLLGMGGYVIGISSIFPNLLPQVYMKIYMAQALDAGGNRGEAAQLLTEALETALPDRMYLPFAENYEGIKAALASGIRERAGMEHIRQLADQLSQSLVLLNGKKIELTAREREILELAKQGLENKDIAERLGIKISTVNNNFSRLYQKAEVSNRTQLLLQNL